MLIPKMKVSVFLFSQLFMLTTSLSRKRVFHANPNNKVTEISYHPTAELEEEKTYIFILCDDVKVNVIYWLGAQAKGPDRIYTAYAIPTIFERFKIAVKDIRNLLITRETSNPRIKTFDELISNYAPQKIPRLYKVAGADNIRQVPLSKNQITARDSLVFDDGSSVIVYHPKLTTKIKMNIADTLAEHIVNVDNDKNYGHEVIPASGNREDYTTLSEQFWKKILNTLEKSDVKSSKIVNKKFKEQMNVIGNSDDAVTFEKVWKGLTILVNANIPGTPEDFYRNQAKSLQNDSPSTSTTASTSTYPTHSYSKKKPQAIKMKTILKVIKNNSFFEHILEHRGVPIRFTVSNSGSYRYGDLILLYMGPEECIPKSQSHQIDSLKSKCANVLKDLRNNEIFMYFGKDSALDIQYWAFGAVEIDFINNPSGKVTIILEGQKIPTPFQLHIEDEYTNIFTQKDLNSLN